MLRELTEELVAPGGILRHVQEVHRVWRGTVVDGDVSLFVVRLGCLASDVQPHPDLRATGTEVVALPFDQYPAQHDTTMFTWRALVAHSTRDYANL